MFPVTDFSQTIIDCLMNEANLYGVEIRMMSEVRSLKSENAKFEIELSDLRHLTSDFVCIACGGYPKALMFRWLQMLGHTISEPVPSLFTFNLPKQPIIQLMGVAVEKARVKIERTKLVEEGPVLITHWGLSGPAILQISSYWQRGDTVTAQFLPDRPGGWLKALKREHPKTSLRKVLSFNAAIG